MEGSEREAVTQGDFFFFETGFHSVPQASLEYLILLLPLLCWGYRCIL